MNVYLRIFLACVPTQLVKAFGIKRLNIYCLVRTVWPLQRQRSAPGVGGWVGRVWGILPYTPAAFLFITLTSVLLACACSRSLHSFVLFVFLFFTVAQSPLSTVKESTVQSGVCVCSRRTGPRYTYSTGNKSQVS